MNELTEGDIRTGLRAVSYTHLLGNESFREAAAGLKLVIAGGETLTESLAESFRRVCAGTLLNMYGPTEAAVCTTVEEVVPGRCV